MTGLRPIDDHDKPTNTAAARVAPAPPLEKKRVTTWR
jgi:hypothetical protein